MGVRVGGLTEVVEPRTDIAACFEEAALDQREWWLDPLKPLIWPLLPYLSAH